MTSLGQGKSLQSLYMKRDNAGAVNAYEREHRGAGGPHGGGGGRGGGGRGPVRGVAPMRALGAAPVHAPGAPVHPLGGAPHHHHGGGGGHRRFSHGSWWGWDGGEWIIVEAPACSWFVVDRPSVALLAEARAQLAASGGDPVFETWSDGNAYRFDPGPTISRCQDMGAGGPFRPYETSGAYMNPRTPGFPAVEPAFAGRRLGIVAGGWHLGSLGTIPRSKIEAAGLADAFAFAGPAPSSNGNPVPSFGTTQNTGARPASSNMLDGQQVGPAVVPIHMRLLGGPQPGVSILGHVPGQPIGATPPAPSPSGAPPPATSSKLPWILGGGAVLALLYFGKNKKRRR
jgi:hypothetical protein